MITMVVLLAVSFGCAGRSRGRQTAPPGADAPTSSEPVAPAPQASPLGTEGQPELPRPSSVTDADLAVADQMFALIEKLVASVIEAGPDCARAADAIRLVGAQVDIIVAANRDLDQRLAADPAGKAWFDQTYAPKAEQTMRKLASTRCMENPVVLEALRSLRM